MSFFCKQTKLILKISDYYHQTFSKQAWQAGKTTEIKFRSFPQIVSISVVPDNRMFNQNKKKIDSKIRFHRPSFQRQLQSARTYKRNPASNSTKSWTGFLSKFKLNSWLSKIITVGVCFLLIYLIYIPNFLFIKHIKIIGAGQETQNITHGLINSYLQKIWPWPQKNVLLLSKTGLANFLLKNNTKILSIHSVQTELPSTLIVDVLPRVDRLLLQKQDSYFTISNDGIVSQIIYPNASGTLPSGLSLVKLTETQDVIIGQQFLSPEQVGYIFRLRQELPQAARSEITYFDLTGNKTTLTAHLKKGNKILFDLGSNLEKILPRLTLLLSQYSDSDLSAIAYVDLRYQDRGYLCLKNAPCAKQTTIVGTSTNDTLK